MVEKGEATSSDPGLYAAPVFRSANSIIKLVFRLDGTVNTVKEPELHTRQKRGRPRNLEGRKTATLS
ncbi:hypothetical protein PIB30_030243 [Stylosanthes scabra]|uniref:Uncharacterized protein n=1 Tax=Stylosanthes scabra TaxID=79078 RepID=A0ABU6W9L7_9FABA|nr:hypothetical protein [Stylosanthes scabra]